MIDGFDAALLAQNDSGAMAMINELALFVASARGGAGLEAKLHELASDGGGEAALGQALRDALAGSASHGALAVLDLLIDKLDIDPAEAALAGSACGCTGRSSEVAATDSDGGDNDLRFGLTARGKR